MEHSRLIDVYMETVAHSSRFLLEDTNGDHGDTTNGDHGSDHDCGIGHTEDHDIEEAFKHIFFLMLFMASLWFVGKLCARCGLPSLVGEILTGIILGPEGLQFVPYADALVVVGEIGLVLLVLEAGIDVSIGHLKVVGFRGLSVAVFGSMLPLGIGTGMAVLNGSDTLAAFAIGACLAPTSMGIALNVLRNAKVLNTPTGQLIIAAAVLDDVIALMLLSELEAMAHPTVAGILMPLLISPAFILFFGFLAIRVTPWLIAKVMSKTAKNQHENVILLLLFLATFLLVPVCKYAGSSYLLGAFLAGLMFCTDHTIHSAWSNQIKRIMQWMLRIFFACTIGFAVPIQDFWSVPVVTSALMYLVAIIGKIATGIFAKPLTVPEFFTIAFSMSAWGEFAFILATASFSTGTIDKQNYSAVLFAVLISVVVSPLCLRANLSLAQKFKARRLKGARKDHGDIDAKGDSDGKVSVYFCVHTKGRGKWGHQDKLLHCIFALNLEIIDFRAFNEAEYNYSHHLPIVQDVFYVRDTEMNLPPTKRLNAEDEKTLRTRYKQIKEALLDAMGDPRSDSHVDVMRWLPGVRRNDDVASPDKKRRGEGGDPSTTKKKRRPAPTTNYCRKEAYKQARLALDQEDAARSSSRISGISRIRPAHDAMHRDRFSYHGAIHTEQDDLIAMALIDTLVEIKKSISNCGSPEPDADGVMHELGADELRQRLMPHVHHLEELTSQMTGLDAAAISDHEPSATLPVISFNDHWKRTCENIDPIHMPLHVMSEGGRHGASAGPRDAGMAEHGKLTDVAHYHSSHGTALAHPKDSTSKPGLRTSRSLPGLPGLPGRRHHHFDHHFHGIPRAPQRIPSVTHSRSRSDLQHAILHHSGTDTEDEHDDDELDTMYGDEDDHHRPLFSALDGLDEDPQEYILNDALLNEQSPLRKGRASRSMVDLTQVASVGEAAREEEKVESQSTEMRPLRRSRTWSKINSKYLKFRHKDAHKDKAAPKDTRADKAGHLALPDKQKVDSVSPAPRLRGSVDEDADDDDDDEGDGEDEEEQPLKINVHD